MMASSLKCEYCGSTIRSDQQFCPNCGAANSGYVPEKPSGGEKKVHRPETIAQLQEFCAERGMPLQRMRFFIGTDERSPRAFGIYRDGDEFVVYKNKADGSRAIRYRGPDEAFAVNELYEKLMEEHALRTGSRTAQHTSGNRTSYGGGGGAPGGKNKHPRYLIIAIVIAAMILMSLLNNVIGQRNNGYYRFDDDLYYHYGSGWYAGDSYGNWTEVDSFPQSDYKDYYEGRSYDESWGSSDFSDSWYWDDLQSSDWDYDDYDYDSWDSSDTDWSSDW